MKTAISQAIELLEKQREALKEMDLLGLLLENEFAHKSNQINSSQIVISQLHEVFEQQITDAYDDGQEDMIKFDQRRSPENYFTQKYKQQ
jgi:hypothetical protein